MFFIRESWTRRNVQDFESSNHSQDLLGVAPGLSWRFFDGVSRMDLIEPLGGRILSRPLSFPSLGLISLVDVKPVDRPVPASDSPFRVMHRSCCRLPGHSRGASPVMTKAVSEPYRLLRRAAPDDARNSVGVGRDHAWLGGQVTLQSRGKQGRTCQRISIAAYRCESPGLREVTNPR